MKLGWTAWVPLCVLALIATSMASGARETDRPPAGSAMILTIDGAIGPATSAYVEEAIAEAEDTGAALVVLRMDTPGGLDSSMRGIVKAINASLVPVAGFVAPSGARAASAGTYILYACHVAAMAPGTNLGAATPVQIGGFSGGGEEQREALDVEGEATSAEDAADGGRTGADAAAGAQDRGQGGEKADETKAAGDDDASPAGDGDASKQKLVNDAVAYIRSLAQLRGRNADWAEKAVREAASLPAEEALALGVIDLMAADVNELLRKLDGRSLTVAGREVTLATRDIAIAEVEPDWHSRLLAIISNPNIAYVLMLVGIYGLIYEFSNPGAVVPGTVGAVSLLLALYAFQLLPVNYAGVALMLLGLALMVAEAFAPSFGALGIGGVIAFIVGSLVLIDTDAPGFGLSIPLVVGFALASALLLVFVIGMAIESRRRPVVSGAEQLLTATGVALGDFAEGRGRVHLHGEVWAARSQAPVAAGQAVGVVARDGLTLLVEPLSKPKEA